MSVLMIATIAFAQDVSQPQPPLPDTISFFDAIQNRHWPLVVALGLTILVWVVRYLLKEKFPSKYVPYVTVVCTVLGAISAGMIYAINSNHAWWHGVINGLLEGLSIALPALGIWSAGVKNILKLPSNPEK
jgi:hypothetical protein